MANSIDMNVTVRDGITACTNKNGVEIICKIPRKSLAKCGDINELKYGGIYLLIGERDGRQMIYVGHSISGLFDKLREHDRDTDKNFWTEALVFTTTDNSFGATEISWLENKFCNMAIKAARYDVTNGNDPSPGNITEEKEIVLEDHAEFAQLILSVIGYKIFDPLPKSTPLPVAQDDEGIFYLSRTIKKLGRKVNAKMKRTPTGYRVLAGSEIVLVDDSKLSSSMKKRRLAANIDASGILRKDEEFTSPSSAALFVIENNANGQDEWRTRDGKPLKNFLGGNDLVH